MAGALSRLQVLPLLPSFVYLPHAEEVAVDLPTTIVSASPDEEAARYVQEVFNNTCMRVYTNPDIKGVISGNDEMALGAIAALKKAGKLKDVVVGGFDGSPDAVAAVKAGELAYTVLQPVAVFAAEGVKQADNFIRTGSTGAKTEKQLFECMLITKENVGKYSAPFVLDN